MSKGRTGTFGTVVVTMCVTSAVLVGGWYGAEQFLSQPTVSPTQEEVPVAAPEPRRRLRRAPQGSDSPGGPQELSIDPALTGGAVAEDEAPGAAPDGELSSPDEQGSASLSADTETATETASTLLEAIAGPTEAHGDARTIMEESQRRGEARFYRYDGLLQSFDTKSKMTEKRWTFDRVGSNGQSKAVLRFTAPAEVKGVALLIYNHPERASDQWMWTPALERDRRIALQDRSTRFFGTDFSFEDLEERDVDQFDYSMLGDDAIDGAACWKIQTTPKKGRSSHYTHSIAWIRKDNYVMARLDNFVKDDVVKRLTNSTIENIQGIWTARQLEMADLRRGTRTRLTLQDVKYNATVKESEFTLEAIRH